MLLVVTMLLSTLPMVFAESIGGTDEQEATGQVPLQLWYDEPVANNYTGWENYSLPIGNSSIGGNVFGRYDTERITLNEKSLWTGGPSESRPDYMGGNLIEKGQNGEALKEIQELFLSGDAAKKNAAVAKCGTDLIGGQAGYGGYQLFGNLYMEFDHTNVENYRRDLDVTTGIATVGYNIGETRYEREYFTSFQDNVMVVHLTAEGADRLNFDLSMVAANDSAAPRSCTSTGTDTELCIAGALNDNQMRYNGLLQVAVSGEGASSQKSGDKLQISGAEEVTVVLSMATDYANDYPQYRTGETDAELAERVRGVVESAAAKSYTELRRTHLDDITGLTERVNLDLGQVLPDIPTDDLLSAYKKNTLSQEEKAYLEVLLYQYGRYLLVSSSRGNTLPANLQGIWVGKNGNPWSSDYHMNVNLQMNYWPAYSGNLAECALPLIDYVESLREPGRITAEVYFGVESNEENPANGFTAHTQNTPFGWTCPGWSFSWGWSPAAVPWILQNVWEYYEFTSDETFLEEYIYPMMKEEVIFYKQIMVQDENGKWLSTPAYSPEHGPYTNGNTYEQSLIWQLFTDTIAAGKIVGEDPEVLAEWQDILDNLRDPIEIGTDGQIKEWYEETTLGSIGDAFGHRHLSHLLGLFPGDLISEETPEWFEAARVSLEARVDKSTGWAMGQRINTWARLRDGERTYELIGYLFGSGILNNLWDTHTPFQIDGNFGYTSGVNEMLLQSQTGAIVPLAAMPAVWSDGSYQGLVARGNFETDATWSDGNLTSFTVRSGDGNTCVISYPAIQNAKVTCDGAAVEFEISGDGVISFSTTAGAEYQITDIPLPPANVTATREALDQVEVSWDAVKNADSYHVYRITEGGNVDLIAANVPETTYVDRTATYEDGVTYQYKVAAVYEGGFEGKASRAISEKWGEVSVPVTSIEITSLTGVTTLQGTTEQIQLLATVQPADAVLRELKWTITDTSGNMTTAATVTQDGLVEASNERVENKKLIVTAAATDGSGVYDEFEILVNVTPANLLLGKTMTYTGGVPQAGDLGNVSYLTDGIVESTNKANRFSLKNVSGNTKPVFSVTLDDASSVQQVNLYERVDYGYDPNGTKGEYRIERIEVQASYDGGNTYEAIGTIQESQSVKFNDYARLWSIKTTTKQPTKHLRFVLNGKRADMIIWEIEAFAEEANLFLGETFTMSKGTVWAASLGTVHLTDGKNGVETDGTLRLATKNTPELNLDIQTDDASRITTIVINERIDFTYGDKTRIDTVRLQSKATDDGAWVDVTIGRITHETITNNIEQWEITGIEVPDDARYLRLIMPVKAGEKQEITIWEIMGYDNSGSRKMLLDALQDAVLCAEEDFDQDDAWTTFLDARAAALTAANNIDTTDNAIQKAAIDLLNAMDGIALEPKLSSLTMETVATLTVGTDRQMTVTAVYAHGSTMDVTSLAEFTSDNSNVISVTEEGVVTGIAAGKATITASYDGKTVSRELEVVQNPNGVLTVVCGVGGTITRSAAAPYVPGQEIQLTAVPDEGYLFVNWLVDDVTNAESSITVAVGTEQRVEAIFGWDYVGEVEALIEAIGEVTLNSLGDIVAAETAYDALSEEDKAKVSEEAKATLKAAREAYEEKEAEAEQPTVDETAAARVDEMIEAIGEVTLRSRVAIQKARAAYDGLTESQKALVTKLSVLEAAETKYRQLKQQQSIVIETITVGGAVDTPAAFPFIDVPATAWYYDEVKEAWENDLIDGMTATEYKPDNTLTVAQAIKLAAALHQMYFEGEVMLENGAINWYDSYVDYAIYNGIIEAKYDNYTLAQMNAAISREEFVHIFFGTMSMDAYYACNSVANNAIPDVKMNDTYAEEIYTFYRAGILTGSDAKGTFNPDSNIKRSEVAAILIRMYDTNARQAVTLG